MTAETLKKIKENVLVVVVSCILSGVIGYFSGIIFTNEKISDLNTKYEKVNFILESNMDFLLKGKTIIDDVDSLKRENQIAIQTNQLLTLRTEQERVNLILALKDLLNGK